jgi:hypothetical protein
MSANGPVCPPVDAWVGAIHVSEHDLEPIGAAVVIDARRVLTCAHVVTRPDGGIIDPLWVAFPKAAGVPRRRVAESAVEDEPPVKDLAILVLGEDVPAGVQAAPLRCPKPSDVVSKQWWAYGFPERDPIGNSADGLVGESLAYGWVRLDASSRYTVKEGFSGAGLWSPDYAAVVAIVGQAHGNGDGRAITLHQADVCFPDAKLAMLAAWSAEAAGEVALAAWGWTLAGDPEGVRHWLPRARGVSIESERGYRFRGRASALTKIAGWLDRAEPDRRVLVVTGSPGVGKSAVLGRIVTTSDAAIRALLPERDDAVRASPGSVSCAVHAKAKTALEVAREIARAVSATLPAEPGELAPAIREVLEARGGPRFNVIIDALDEAASPAQARAIVSTIVLPLAETCAAAGAQVVVGTRRYDDEGRLLSLFGSALVEVDLDDHEYFEEEDLAAYALACLQLAGDERPGNPYADDAVAVPVARRIAGRSDRNFLVAGLVARGHGMRDEQAADPGQLTFDATVASALASYLEQISPVAGLPANHLLTALAFAEAPGLPAALWQVVIEAMYGARVGASELSRFARSSAANFLVESGTAGTSPVFRLFHQALNDALLGARSGTAARLDDERALTRALMGYGRGNGWESAPEYLHRSLPGHAAAAGLIDDLLGDDAYLLYADLRRLMLTAGHGTSPESRRRTQLLGLTPQALSAGSSERAALFSVTEALENLGASYPGEDSGAPYLARWARTRHLGARSVLEGHRGAVYAMCAVTVAGRDLLASGSYDKTMRIWDPVTGELCATLEGHQDGLIRGMIHAMSTVPVAGRDLLASGGVGKTVRIWDPATGKQRAVLKGHRGGVNAVCAVTVDGQDLLASGGDDMTVRIWDPATGKPRAVLEGHQGRVNSLCAVTVDGQDLLASGGGDKTVRIWDPATGKPRAVLKGHRGSVRRGRLVAVCAVTVDGRDLLASGSSDKTVRIWDPATGELCAVLKGHPGRVNAVCAVPVAGRDLLASGGGDEKVGIWDPATGKVCAVLKGHQGWVNAVCAVPMAGRDLLASSSSDRTVRIWDPATGGCLLTIPVHHEALSVSSVAGSLAIGLRAGLLVIDLCPTLLPEQR